MIREQETASALIWTGIPLRVGAIRAIGLAVAYLVLGALTLSPLLWTTIPPLVDYPNHLARMSVLLHAGDGSVVTTNYVAHWRLLPNLAMDLVVPVVAHLIPLEAAGRLFVAMTMALLMVATVALHRALHGRIGFWPLAALLFLYNAVLWWGFVNYLFGLGVALLAFSGWIATKRWPMVPRLVAFAVIACMLFVLHLFAFGVYGLLVASHEAGTGLTNRRSLSESVFAVATALAQFIPAGFLWLAAASGPHFTAYGGLNARLYALTAPVMFNVPPSLYDTALLICTCTLLPIALHAGALKLSPSMRLPLIAMITGAILMPEYLSGSWAAQMRLPVALIFVIIASTEATLSRRLPVLVCAGALVVLLGTRVWGVSQSWRDMDDRVTELRAAMRTLPEGIRLLTVQSPMPADERRLSGVSPMLATQAPMTYWHWPALAVIDRGAFVPALFTGWYPVEASARNAGLSRILGAVLTPEELVARAHADPRASPMERNVLGETICCLDWPQTFDFVLWIDFGQAPQTLLPELVPWASGRFFHIYRVSRS